MKATVADDGRLVLWGVGTSRTMRAHWALAELGLDYECRPIQPRTGETKTPEYTALTARQKVPLLQDGAFTITESAAIVTYLSDTYGTGKTALVPSSAKERIRCLEWCFFIISELDAASLYVIRRHRYLAEVYGPAPEVCDQAAAYFGQQMRTVLRQLEEMRPYLLGDRLTAPDILLSTCLTLAASYGAPIDARAAAYNARMTERAAHCQAAIRNTPPAS
ncbi:MAG: glutathione S-transferase family protein [Burkholderiales bacterium]